MRVVFTTDINAGTDLDSLQLQLLQLCENLLQCAFTQIKNPGFLENIRELHQKKAG